MHSFTKLAVPFSGLLTAALAIQNVIVVPLSNGCADYPGYDPSTGITDGFLVTLYDCDNAAVNGHGDTEQVIRQQSGTATAEGRVYIPCSFIFCAHTVSTNEFKLVYG